MSLGVVSKMMFLGPDAPVFATGLPSPLLEEGQGSAITTEMVETHFEPWGVSVQIFMPRPDGTRLEAIANRPARIGMVPVTQHGWIWLLGFDGEPPYQSPHLPAASPSDLRALSRADRRATAQIALSVVDEGGIVRVVRKLDLPTRFVRELKRLRDLARRKAPDFAAERCSAEWNDRLRALKAEADPFRYASATATVATS